MIHRRRVLRLLCIVLLPVAATAQQRVLTLDETLRLADEQSIDVQRAQVALERSTRAVETARGLYLPEVTASGDYMFNIQRQVLFIPPGTFFNESGSTQTVTIGGRHTAGLALNVTQPLYDPQRRMQRVVAEAGVEVSKAQRDMVRALVRMNAEKAFYRALYAKGEQRMREEQVRVAMSNLDITIARYKGGRAMALDTLTANVTVARARAEAERSRYNYLGMRLALAQTLNIPDYQNIDVQGDLEIPTAPGPSGGGMVAPYGSINSAQLQVAEAERALAQTNVALESYSAYPTLNAVGRWQALGQGNDMLPDDLRWAMTSQIGVNAFYPIYNLWRGNPRREDAELRVKEAELEIARIRHDDSARAETLLLAMQGMRAQIVAEEASVEQAVKAVDITMILYKEGRASLLDVENAQSRVLDAQLVADRIKLQFLESYAELKATMGE